MTFEAKAVTSGNVIFECPAKGILRVAPLDDEGRFIVPDLAVAEYTITIQPPEPQRPNESTSSIAEIRAARNAPPPPDRKDIPVQFRSSQTSPLKRSVVAGDNEFDFDLSANSRR